MFCRRRFPVGEILPAHAAGVSTICSATPFGSQSGKHRMHGRPIPGLAHDVFLMSPIPLAYGRPKYSLLLFTGAIILLSILALPYLDR